MGVQAPEICVYVLILHSFPSKRQSTESRASTSTRSTLEWPTTDKTFKKSCIDNVFWFLDAQKFNGYEDKEFTRKWVVQPTTRDFMSILNVSALSFV